MRKATLHISALFALSSVLAACASAPETAKSAKDPLTGTRWQLVTIEYMDDTTVTPDDGAKYTLAFNADGTAAIKADCNMLNGAYVYTPPSGVEFGPLRSTRAACPPGSLYQTLVKDVPFMRSFVIKEGDLYIALMADGGIYRFTPMR